jgi:hypothetical protein
MRNSPHNQQLVFPGPRSLPGSTRQVLIEEVRTINSLTLKEWIEEFCRLKELSARMMRTANAGRTAREQSKL